MTAFVSVMRPSSLSYAELSLHDRSYRQPPSLRASALRPPGRPPRPHKVYHQRPTFLKYNILIYYILTGKASAFDVHLAPINCSRSAGLLAKKAFDVYCISTTVVL